MAQKPVLVRRVRRRKSLLLIPVVLAMIWCLIPLYVMLVGALKPSVALSLIPADLNPFTNLRLTNFADVMESSRIGRAFLNSLIISVSTCVLTVAVGMMGGYAFAKRKFFGKKALFMLLMVTMMLPNQVMMIPRYMVAKNLELTNELYGVILTTINAAYAIFLCRQFILSIPDELLGAARIDGCSEFQGFFHISQNIGIDTIINKKLIAASYMVRYTLGSNVSSLKCLSGIDADIVEFIVRDGAAVTEKTINRLNMPDGAIIGGVIRGEDSFIATGNFQIQAEDRVVVLVLPKTIQEVEKLFR